MLAWQGNRLANTFCDKDTAELVESLKECLSGRKSTGSDCVSPEDVTEVHEC